MDDIMKKDLKFTASIFFTIAFHAILWKLIEIYLIWSQVKNAAEAALAIVLLLSIGTAPFMMSVLDDWIES